MKLLPGKTLLFCVFILLMLGLVMVYSSSAIVSASMHNDAGFYFKRQMINIFLGLIAIFIGLKIHPDFYKKYSYHFYFIVLALLALLLVPGIGKTVGGASRWISLGFIRFQPGEIFKLTLVIYLATIISSSKNRIQIFSLNTAPHLLALGLALILLLLQPDFGTTILSIVLMFIMFFIGGTQVIYLLIALLLAIPIVLQLIALSPYRLDRIIAFLDPWSHRQNEGYQIVESLISFGSGGFWGHGLGQGPGKLFYLPAAHTDFVLSIIGEELGFIGVALVIICFITIVVCGFKIAISLTEPFYIYLAAGFTALLAIQATLNAFVVMGLVPTKGITLPFVSFGGSSLILSCFIIGVIARLGNETTEENL